MYVVQQLAFERPSLFPLLWHLKLHIHFANTYKAQIQVCGLPFGPSSLDISSKEGALAASSAKMSQSTKKYPVILHLQPEVRFGSILSVFSITCQNLFHETTSIE